MAQIKYLIHKMKINDKNMSKTVLKNSALETQLDNIN